MIVPSVSDATPTGPAPRRADLHCHSEASNKAAEVLLTAISCPECYSAPTEVHAQAKRRGMDFVTITDHDTIDGVLTVKDRTDVLVGEELTCWFPEDDCKLHLLLWGITPEDHGALQACARNMYQVAEYVEKHNIAHAVAHPIYRQNDRLERWHLERLLLLFKGFECLNGAHSALHRDAFEPLLDNLSRAGLMKLSEKHSLAPRWPTPWIKARTGGSDDHGLLNVGRTWTEFPADTNTVEDLLQCLRDGTCKPSGEAGSSTKLAHTFYGVAVRYYTRHILNAQGGPANLPTQLLQMIVGERQMPTKGQLAKQQALSKLKQFGRRAASPFTGKGTETRQGTALLRGLFMDAIKTHMGKFPALRQALENGLPPLGEHDEMLRFVSALNRQVTGGIADAIGKSVDDASFTALFDAIASIIAQQFVLAPYYFALFHQNRERRLLRKITGQYRPLNAGNIKVGLFTDTFDEVNGVGRFLRDLSRYSNHLGRSLVVHTCVKNPLHEAPNRKNFEPLLSKPMPYYPELEMNLPPLLEVLDWADRQQFDAVHVSTPGPMGMIGWLVAKMLRVPLLGTYHTDFPAYMETLSGDHRAAYATRTYFEYFYSQFATVFTRSRGYLLNLRELGIAENRSRVIHAGVDIEKFQPGHRNPNLWQSLGVKEPRRLVYAGRVSVEKNLPVLVETFKKLCATRSDTALVIAGEGPYLKSMREALAGLPAYFLGYQNDLQLGPLYAGGDLFIFPSRTDTLGQVVMEAQASGLPAIVSNEGGPKEVVEADVTGIVLPNTDPDHWARTIDALLNDEATRQRMGRSATQRMARFSVSNMFDGFWNAHVEAADAPAEEEETAYVPPAVPETVKARG